MSYNLYLNGVVEIWCYSTELKFVHIRTWQSTDRQFLNFSPPSSPFTIKFSFKKNLFPIPVGHYISLKIVECKCVWGGQYLNSV